MFWVWFVVPGFFLAFEVRIESPSTEFRSSDASRKRHSTSTKKGQGPRGTRCVCHEIHFTFTELRNLRIPKFERPKRTTFHFNQKRSEFRGERFAFAAQSISNSPNSEIRSSGTSRKRHPTLTKKGQGSAGDPSRLPRNLSQIHRTLDFGVRAFHDNDIPLQPKQFSVPRGTRRICRAIHVKFTGL